MEGCVTTSGVARTNTSSTPSAHIFPVKALPGLPADYGNMVFYATGVDRYMDIDQNATASSHSSVSSSGWSRCLC
jgi:hypothetical protein